jgi:hypothetical protein
MITIKQKIQFKCETAGKRRITTKQPVSIQQPGRIPRISKLMALAIRYDGMLKNGEAADQSTLADLLQITQPRMTQIMNLLHLAPDIQEELLHLPPVDHGRDQIHERMLRPLTTINSWQAQRKLLVEMKKMMPLLLKYKNS